jgi:integrase
LTHHVIFSTMYGTGLRVSEALHLRVPDLDSQRMMIRIEQGKGHRDRYVPLSPKLLELLRTYWRKLRPQPWLFPGQFPNQPLRREAVRDAIARASERAGLKKQISPHSLRHYTASPTMPLKLPGDLFAGFWLFIRGIVRLGGLTLWMNDQEGFCFPKNDRTASSGAFE